MIANDEAMIVQMTKFVIVMNITGTPKNPPTQFLLFLSITHAISHQLLTTTNHFQSSYFPNVGQTKTMTTQNFTNVCFDSCRSYFPCKVHWNQSRFSAYIISFDKWTVLSIPSFSILSCLYCLEECHHFIVSQFKKMMDYYKTCVTLEIRNSKCT